LPAKKKKSLFSSLLKIICLFIFIAVLFVACAIGVLIYFNSPLPLEKMPHLSNETEGIRKAEDGSFYVDIRRGESSQSAGMRLERAGLIRNRYFWNLYCRFDKEHIKNGTYKIEIPVNMVTVHSLLVEGKQILYRVTIPEGVTLSKMALILEEAGICNSQEFLTSARSEEIINQYGIPNNSMEGYLFPDTYLFPHDYPPHMVIKTMIENFYNKIESIDPSVTNLDKKELNDKVILASIVEREYRVTEEAPVMAGVFLNRLRINMALQSCATVEYIITEIQGKPHPPVIYNQDLEIRDPYNTYLRPGLPPGPISAPGLVALRAVIFPENTEYFYFRLNDPATGRHYFSRSFDEHIRAGQLFTKS